LAQADGYVPTGEGIEPHTAAAAQTRLSFKITTPQIADRKTSIGSLDQPGSQWAGMSGAAVTTSEGLIIGVVRSHSTTEGEGSLSITPIGAISSLPESTADQFWKCLGVAAVDQLATLPRSVAKRMLIAERLSDEFVERSEGDLIVDALGAAPGSTVGVVGGGGFGKSGLASWVARRPEIEDAFPDGVLWVTIGQDRAAVPLRDLIVDACQQLTSHFRLSADVRGRDAPTTVGGASRLLADMLGERRILMIVDDVWRASDLEPFLAGGPRTARLVTTRLDQVLPYEARRIHVDAMSADGVERVLSMNIPPAAAPSLKPLLQVVHGWVLLARLVNGRVRREMDHGAEPEAAAQTVMGLLTDLGLTALDQRNEAHRSRAVDATLSATFEILSDDERQRFESLAVFPGDTDVRVEILADWWKVQLTTAAAILSDFRDASLLQSFDSRTGIAKLHDVVRGWLHQRMGHDIQALHLDLTHVLLPSGRRWSQLDSREEYVWRYFVWHAAQGGPEGKATVASAVRDLDYLSTKTVVLGTAAVEADLALAADSSAELTALLKRYRQLTGFLGSIQEPQQLAANLWARLFDLVDPSWEPPPTRLRPVATRPLPVTDPYVERTLRQGSVVSALAWAADGRLASGGADGWVRVWPKGGGVPREHRHGDTEITCVAWSEDGRLASGARDGRVCVWSADEEKPVVYFHGSHVSAVAWSKDGRLASGGASSADEPTGTVVVSDGAGGPTIEHLHAQFVSTVAWSMDGSLASGASDASVCVWRRQGATVLLVNEDRQVLEGDPPWTGPEYKDELRPDGTTERRYKSDQRFVNTLAWSDEGWLAIGCDDDTLRVWSDDGRLLLRADNAGSVYNLVWTAEGSLLGLQDGGVCKWDLTGPLSYSVPHGDWVSSLALSTDGDIATGSGDGRICIWPPDVSTFGQHDTPPKVTALAWSRDGDLASGTDEGLVEILHPDDRPASLRQAAEGRTVYGLAWSHQGALACRTGSGFAIYGRAFEKLFESDGDFSTIGTVAWSRSGWLAFAESYGRILVFEPEKLEEPIELLHGGGEFNVKVSMPENNASVSGPRGTVLSLAWSEDGRLASGATDGSLWIWPLDELGADRTVQPEIVQSGDLEPFDADAFVYQRRNDVSANSVRSLSWAADGRLASGAADGSVTVRAPGTRELLIHLSSQQINAIAWIGQDLLAVGSETGQVFVARITEGNQAALVDAEFAFDRACSAVAVQEGVIACAAGETVIPLEFVAAEATRLDG
jgi:WD40 repeat protein